MTLATPPITDFTGGEMSPRLEGRIDLKKYYSACRHLENFIVYPHGGVTLRGGFRFVYETYNDSDDSLLVPFEFNNEQTYILEFSEDIDGHGKARVFKDSGIVLDGGSPYEFDIPWGFADHDDIYFAQSNDVLFIVHPDYAPRTITRTGDTAWTVATMDITGQPDEWGTNNWPSTVCFFEERLVLAGVPDQPGRLWMSRTGDYYDFRLRTRQAPVETVWDDYTVGGTGAGKDSETFTLLDGLWFEEDFAVRGISPVTSNAAYFVYKGDKAIQASGSDKVLTFKDTPAGANDIEAVYDGSDILQTAYWDEYARGDYVTVSGYDPLPDDGIDFTITSRKGNAIEFTIPRGKLYVGTAGSTWVLGGGTASEAISPDSVKADEEDSIGSANVRPVVAGSAALYLQRGGRKLREMQYNWDTDSYKSTDLTIVSEHITRNGLTQLAQASAPDSTVFGVREDGQVVALTYERPQDVIAWSRLTTEGNFKRIAVIYDSTNEEDQLWASVTRTVNGAGKRFIEFMEAPLDRSPNPQIEDAFYLDSGVTYDGAKADTLTDLAPHLANQEVCVLADGAIHPDVTVGATGTVELEREASVVHVGFAYTGVCQPNRLEAGSKLGTTQTKRQRITNVEVRFYNTVGGKLGPSETDLDTIYFRDSSMSMDEAVPLFSGDKRVLFPGGWKKENILTIVQDQPLPMTIVMIVPKAVVYE